MHFSKSLQGSKLTVTMRPVSIELTLLLFFLIKNFLFKNNVRFTQTNMKSVYHGPETVTYLGPKISDLVPHNIKDSENVNNFKSTIKLVVLSTLVM